ncbi:hypothetical protein C5N99_07500 [Treponema medium]|uniref:hypothetical protein n=1 Tax=Treponema medium TaxID=58231 RepID=UPI00197F6D66|nr:hypothetical protein [Treponema medium]QSH92307.1 hypothetical protein C5N99_06780 [Treponema medium]QSH92444.1 hypothetical protein C5N99_07500 [Treponema medium]
MLNVQQDTPAVNLCSRLVVSERTRMSGGLISSDVFAQQKLVVRTPKDGRDINQKRVLYKTRLFPTYTEVCREKVYTEVHFWTGYLQKRWKGGAFITLSRGLYGLNFNQYVIRKC